MSNLSWLNPTAHAIAVYASHPLSPVATQHSPPSGRYSLLGPDLHRLIAPALLGAFAKPLSEQLADLSVRAKNAEDAVAAAQKEAHDKVVARKEQARAAEARHVARSGLRRPGRRIAGPPIDEIELGIVQSGDPARSSAGLPGVGVLRPGLAPFSPRAGMPFFFEGAPRGIGWASRN
jgi:hypothetical protein